MELSTESEAYYECYHSPVEVVLVGVRMLKVLLSSESSLPNHNNILQ